MNRRLILLFFNVSFAFCLYDCDFESPCEWTWDENQGIQVVSAENSTHDPSLADSEGNFLYYEAGDSRRLKLISPPLEEGTGNMCSLETEVYMYNMEGQDLVILVVTDKFELIVAEIRGNSDKRWKQYKIMIGRVTHRFRLVLETEHFNTSQHYHVAIDKLRLVDCIRDRSRPRSCEPYHFRCMEGTCYERDRVCDLTPDCSDGKDEQECDLLPQGSMCNFEDGFCGWRNIDGNHGSWIRNNGSNRKYRKGPSYDHTYENSTGIYVSAYFHKTRNTFGHQAVLRSEWFRPPPLYHRLSSSSYYKSCKVRFHYHIYGNLAAHLWLECVVLNHKQQEGKPIHLWGTKGNQGDVWHRHVIPLPNITSSFALQFVATSNVRVATDIAIDDVSLSPECFGFGVPENESRGTLIPEENDLSVDNAENYRYVFGTCNAKGHLGPDSRKCSKAYRNTSTRVSMRANHIFSGVQIWSVPETNVYTLFAGGASGGQGVNNRGVSKGAVVRAAFNWTAGELIYILVGQKGSSACSTRLPKELRKRCEESSGENRNIETASRARKKKGGGGGGGGATFVFKVKLDGLPEAMPLLVAAGGGGLSSYLSNTSSLVYEGSPNGKIQPKNGYSSYTGAGGGGGWKDASISHTAGQSAWEGGRGGSPCFGASEWMTHGGFGGGGGGCHAGGGGGGFRGGDASEYDDPHASGQNGVSFVSPNALLPLKQTDVNEGDGFLEILAAQRGCGCQYLCVVTQMSEVAYYCICPDGTAVEDDGKSCSGFTAHRSTKQTLYTSQLVVTVLSCLAVLAIVAFVAILTLSRRRTKRLGKTNHKPQENAEFQLNRLRQSGGRMVTEYNPNYEFGGSTCSLQDLREIPRDTLTLVRALGQGAFGEVYQGYVSNLPGENRDVPVAVKTLPEFSSNEAEMDFLMEALIMSKFNHPNIVEFIGVCFEKLPRFIILELLLGGDLKSFLRESRPKPSETSRLNMADLLNLALDVAKGCHYLEDHHFIHRDIAARNCLLTMKGHGRVVKIADFGMARDIYRADYYRKGGKAMLPIKWMPPEAFLDGIFTCKTDIWSFGVLLWEVMSLGYMPYPGRGNQEVMQLVTSGGRLEPPTNCPNPVYHVMRQCWHPVPDERPCFNTVIERLGYCLQDPDVLSAPLPVFNRPPSMERDATVMRPLDCEGLCLQVRRPERDMQSPNSEDYMMPMPSSNYSLSTERTELQTSSSESIDKLLEINDRKQQENTAPRKEEDSWEAKFVQPKGQQKRADGYSQLPYIWCDKNNVKFSSMKSLDSATKTSSHSDKSTWDANSVVLDIMALGKPGTENLPFRYINIDVNSNSRNRLDNAEQSQLNHNLLDNYSYSNPAVSPLMADNRRVNC